MGFAEGMQALSAPVTKLVEAVSNAIGKAYEPRYRRKMADAKAYEIKRIADEIRNNSDLPIVYNGTETLVDISDFDALRKRAGNRLAYQEMLKQENIESVVDKATIELDGKELESDETISPEWMNRFIDMAGEISTEEMQNIWAKVLAGEVVKPSSYSMKTLECLRNLSVKDAELFGKIAAYVISDGLVYGDNELNEKYNIFYNDILALDDCGLINSSGMIILKLQVHDQKQLVLDFDKYILMASSTEKRDITLPQFPLTRAGRELLPIARNKAVEDQYIADVIESARRKNKEVQFTLHEVNHRLGNNINYKKESIELNRTQKE